MNAASAARAARAPGAIHATGGTEGSGARRRSAPSKSGARRAAAPGVRVAPQRRELVQPVPEEPLELRAEGAGRELPLRRGEPAGDDVVRVDLVDGDAHRRRDRAPPLALDAQRVEVGRRARPAPTRRTKAGISRAGSPSSSAKPMPLRGQVLGGPGEPAQHEVVVPQRRAGKGRGEAEDDHEGLPAPQREVLGEEQRPVVAGALVAAHPVDDGTRDALRPRRRAGSGLRAASCRHCAPAADAAASARGPAADGYAAAELRGGGRVVTTLTARSRNDESSSRICSRSSSNRCVCPRARRRSAPGSG